MSTVVTPPVAAEAPAAPPAGMDWQTRPTVVSAVDPSVRALRRRRQVILGVLVAVVVLSGLDLVVGQVRHDQRQRHLAAEVAESKPLASIRTGQALAVLQVPRLGLNQVVVEGAGATQLRGGPGHVVGTASPGHRGNAVIVARSTRAGAPFELIRTLQQGDEIALRTRAQEVITYRVDRVVRGDRALAARRPSTDARLTLVTSAPGFASDRLVAVVAIADAPVTSSQAAPRLAVPAGSLDDRPGGAGAVVVVLGVLVLAALVVVAAIRLPARTGRAATAAVVLSGCLLLAVTWSAAIDLVMPATW